MKFLRDNFAYILLALIAIVLIFVTINLQMAILARQGTTAGEGRGVLYTVRQQLAELILPATDTPTSPSAPQATPVPLPTNTPIVIMVQPTALPVTATSVAPTATAIALLVNTPTIAPPTPTALPPLPTPSATVAVLPTPLPTPPPAVLPAVDVDFRLGYIAQNPDCVAVTELMQLVLERDFDLRIATVAFPDSAALFEKLAAKTEAERVDLTFCYIDPVDRSFLQKYFGFMIFIGSGYRQVENQKFIIMSNAAIKSPIERGNPCLYRFLTKLDLTEIDWNSGDAATWYQRYADQITSLAPCD